MSDAPVAIRVAGLSKRFSVYASPLDHLRELLFGKVLHQEFWALRDVTFAVKRGEVVGIVGRNGAGKSTLLKILTGTLERTSGSIEVHGRISSILELGTGFHPDFSGRENVYLSGMCLGMPRNEVDAKIDSIINFSELADFIEQPLKSYSTGMQARLAFSTAIAVDPDVLIVDEALAVGDVRFQRKCFARFQEFRDQGRTILFVSHSVDTVDTICDRAIYIADGTVRAQGPTRAVTGLYLKETLLGNMNSSAAAPVSPQVRNPQYRYGTGEAEIIYFAVLDEHEQEQHVLESGRDYTMVCRVLCNREVLSGLHIGFNLQTIQGVRLFSTNPTIARVEPPSLRRGDVCEARVAVKLMVGPGEYFMTFGAFAPGEPVHFDRRVDALQLTVVGASNIAGSLVNVVPQYRMMVTRLNGELASGAQPVPGSDIDGAGAAGVGDSTTRANNQR